MFRKFTYWLSYPFHLIYRSLVCHNDIDESENGDTITQSIVLSEKQGNDTAEIERTEEKH